MKCIDAIEGTVKSIITKLYQEFAEGILDDTEYIRNVKVVIEGTDEFIQVNKEIVNDPQLLKQVLYEFSKTYWLNNLGKIRKIGLDADPNDVVADEDGYDEYYFDYIYNQNTYPR